MTNVLIAGCGYVGVALGEALAARGHAVWGLRRDVAGLPNCIRSLRADLNEAPPEFPARFDFVFYTAGADGGDEAAYRRAFVDGPLNLLGALAAQGQAPRRVFFTSSISVYAQNDGSRVDELSPTEPKSFRGQIMLESERVFLDGPFPATIARLGGVYGPGRAPLLDDLRGGNKHIIVPDRHSNRIHRDDAAGALAHLMGLERPEDLYVVGDREPKPFKEIAAWLAKRLGVEAVIEAGATGSRRTGDKRCDSGRLVESGYEFLYSTFREGFEAILRKPN